MKRRELRSRILAKYDTFGDFARAMKVTPATMSNWVNGGSFPVSRIYEACELLDIKREEIGEVFFPIVESGKV